MTAAPPRASPRGMSALRLFLLRHRALALCLVLASLALKLVVPAGYMAESGGSRVLTVRVCEESSGSQAVRQIAVPLKAEHGSAPAGKPAKDACAFAGHGAAALAGADPVLLALALAFALALGFAPVHRPATRTAAYLRPPCAPRPSRPDLPHVQVAADPRTRRFGPPDRAASAPDLPARRSGDTFP